MPDNFGEIVRPLTGDVDEAPGGRLARLFCRLAGDRFTGVVYVEHEQAGGVFSFRDGKVVFAEGLGEAQTFADTLLEKQLLTKAQYAEIATQVVESLAENEEVAFCEYAVSLGILSKQQIDAEVARAVRGSVIQAIGWQECRIEVDADPDTLSGILEYPQAVGPLVHIGVRTFFDEERIRAVLGREGELYARLLRAESEISGLLGLDENEAALVARIRPDQPLSRSIDESGLDSFEAWQVVCTLALANIVEIGSAPFTAAERSGVRTTQAAAPSSGKYSSPTDVREERVRAPSQARMPAARELPARPPSQGRLVAAREEDGRSGSQARINVGRGPDGRALSQPRIPIPVVREEPPRQPTPPTRSQQSATRANTPNNAAIPSRGSSGTSSPSTPRIDPFASAPPVHERPPQRPSAQRPEPSAPNELPAAPVRDRARPRKLSSALKRLDRDLKQLRAPTGNSVVEPLPTAPPGTTQASYARARVEQLRQMRNAAPAGAAQAPKAAAPQTTKSQDLYRSAQEAMRDQQFGKAHELMRKACEAEPDNQVYSMYGMWAAFRANALRQEEITKLRLVLRERVSDDQHKAFAYYALGHISLAEKKDDAAEKFFIKAVELDKNNKDAERHVRIIAVRRKAADQDKANKIFGIEIGPKKGS